MRIDDTQTWSVVQLNKVICEISAQYVEACKKKVQKTVYFMILRSKRGITPIKMMQIDDNRTWSVVWWNKSYAKFQLNMKSAENCVFSVFEVPKGALLLQKFMTLKLDLQYSKTKSYAKFQLNMSKHVRKVRKTVYFQYSKFQKGHNFHKH